MQNNIRCFFLTCTDCIYHTNNNTVHSHIFLSDDGRKFHLGNIIVTLENGEELLPAPIGAMWDGDWFKDCSLDSGLKYDRNADGIVLIVRTPGGDWVIDGPSFENGKESGFWTRTGKVPNITVTPSINIVGKYHGFLKNGYLESC